ncbi:hypothetical protein PROQFM164_S02g003104 [Penicillium roqueforti FM164]|uniref:Uncharacterized protein n=1 Tax=Penicillium roqueforti (strain FM164) TaxID=1365484 RepID=W6Q8C4_PENRF|nr:hypothetical protein PROQFM164_S02g003104 [Penicillium roqueforti FM164]
MDVNAWKQLHYFHVPIRSPKVSAQWEKCYQENRISSINMASIVCAQVCFRAIYIKEAPTVTYIYQLDEPIESYKVSPFPVHKMDNPQFMIEHGDVATYIISSAPYNDRPITTDLLSGILSRHIGYAPPTFIKNLIGSNASNTDLEYMVVLYSLLIMDILPPSSLHTPIKRILYSHNGEDLIHYLMDNLDIRVESQLGRI